MPSKKRKYNARFPAGRIKKIMQTDEEVGKVAQAVPIIISEYQYFTWSNCFYDLHNPVHIGKRSVGCPPARCTDNLKNVAGTDWMRKAEDPVAERPMYSSGLRWAELIDNPVMSKAMQVTMARNAKTLSPPHVKQCILAESKFDFLRDLVKNIPDVSAAEEKEMMSAESSPNSSRFTEMPIPPRRIAREDSNSSSSCDVKVVPLQPPRDPIKRALSTDTSRLSTDIENLPHKLARTETVTSTSLDTAIDLSKKSTEEKPVITANFYQETLLTDEVQHRSVIKLNPTYASPQPSTSYTPEPLKIEMVPKPAIIDKPKPIVAPRTPVTPITPILNIDFTKNFANPEIKLLDTAAINVSVPKKENSLRQINRQNSKTIRQEVKKIEIKPVLAHPVDIDSLNSGNLQIDEDYDT